MVWNSCVVGTSTSSLVKCKDMERAHVFLEMLSLWDELKQTTKGEKTSKFHFLCLVFAYLVLILEDVQGKLFRLGRLEWHP